MAKEIEEHAIAFTDYPVGKYSRKIDWWTSERGIQLIAGWRQAGCTIEEITQKMGVDKRTFRSWRKKCPALEDALVLSKEIATVQVVNSLYQRAVGMEYDEVTRELVEGEMRVTKIVTKYIPPDVKAILAAGHDIGNHSENHKNMSQLSTDEMKSELMEVHDRVKNLTGYEMTLFRPPYGDYSNEVIQTATSLGYYSIQWDVDSLDWKDYGVDSIVDTVCNHKHLGNGSIILCHNGAKYTAQALDTLITTLKGKGYEFVKVSDLIYKENYTMDVEGRQIPNAG